MKKFILLLFLALCFDSEYACQSWITAFEARWHSTDPAWKYGFPHALKDGRWCSVITVSAEKYLTEAERAACVELTESDLPDPPPLPE